MGDLLMWKTPLKTGAVLASFNVLFFVVVFLEVSLTPFFCSIGMLAIFIGGAIKYAAPQCAEFNVELMSKIDVQCCAAGINAAAVSTKDAVLWTSNDTTIKALVVLELVRRLSPWVSLTSIIFLGGNLVFVLPYVLEAKKDMIQKSVEPHIKKFT